MGAAGWRWGQRHYWLPQVLLMDDGRSVRGLGLPSLLYKEAASSRKDLETNLRPYPDQRLRGLRPQGSPSASSSGPHRIQKRFTLRKSHSTEETGLPPGPRKRR